jgi:nitrite reductase/ring-hydroxylating ferredoxin subunit
MHDETDGANWVAAADAQSVPVGGRKVVRHDGHRIALFRPTAEHLYAIDDRCPHEGYPLYQAELRDCVLTCAYHNFKFDLRTGRCLKGDEDARVYPVRERDGAIEIDLSDPPAAERIRRELEVVDDGLLERRLGQVARAVVKILALGGDPAEVALAACRFDAARGEYGTTHVLPVAVDLLPIVARYPGPRATLPLLAPLELAADSHVRRPLRQRAEPIDPGADPRAAGERLRELIEREDLAAAEGHLRGALARGIAPDLARAWLIDVCSDHFLGFGHGLIYVTKAFELFERVGWRHADDILPALVVSLGSQTREDTLPAWHRYRERVSSLAPRLSNLLDRARQARRPAPDGLANELVNGRRGAAMDAVMESLDAGSDPDAIAAALVRASALRMLRFDVSLDADITVQEDWLDVTHRLTFAHAVRQALAQTSSPDALRLLVQAAQFLSMAAPLDGPQPERAPRPGEPPALETIVASIVARETDAAITLAASFLAAGGDPATLRAAMEDHILDHAAVRPIIVAHLIKTCRVAFDEAARDGDVTPILAVVKLAASPARERAAARTAHEAIRFVVHDKVPRSLT